MTTSHTSFLYEIEKNKEPIPEAKLAYFRERQRNRLYSLIIGNFLKKESSGSLTRSDLAKRINKDRAQITRWLTSPGNWTLDTISDLILAIDGAELIFEASKLKSQRRNYKQIDHLIDDNSKERHLSSVGTKSSPILIKSEIIQSVNH